MASRVVHFDISANDPEKLKKFYEEAFGWEIKKWEGEDEMGGMNYWLIKTGPKEEMGIDGGMLLRSDNPKTGQDKAFVNTIGVSDIDEAISKVKAAGGKIMMEKSEMKGIGWFASAQDSEGNNFNLMQATGNMEEM